MTKPNNRARNREEALARFIHHVGTATELASRIATYLDDHMGVDPDAVNWAHVGSAAHAADQLRNVAISLGLIDEDAPENQARQPAASIYKIPDGEGGTKTVTIPEE